MNIDDLIKQKEAEKENLFTEWGKIFIDDLIKNAYQLKKAMKN